VLAQGTDDVIARPEYQMTHRRQTLPLWSAFVLTLAGCAGRAQGAESAPAAPVRKTPAIDTMVQQTTPPERAEAPSWLVVDSAGQTATLAIEVTAPAGAPSALINGYRAGEVQVVVPRGWTVKWNWRSADSSATHSLVVMVQREKIPLEGGRSAFSNAMTRMVTEGLSPGQTDQTTFVADEAGYYWLLCGVPSHALKGEWIELRVDPSATTASVVLKKKA
jgi:hypothetical protein